jgi:hypothetical protein
LYYKCCKDQLLLTNFIITKNATDIKPTKKNQQLQGGRSSN